MWNPFTKSKGGEGNSTSTSSGTGKAGVVVRLATRGLQLVLALVAVGTYAHRVDVDRRAGATQNAEWVFAVAVSGLAGLTALVYGAHYYAAGFFRQPQVGIGGGIGNDYRFSRWNVSRYFAWDALLCLLWIVTFGIFGSLYLHRADGAGSYEGTSTRLEKAVVWVDMVSAVLWCGSAGLGFYAWRTRGKSVVDAYI